MNLLITGASGFIGSRVVDLLKSEGITFRTLGRSKNDSIYFDFETDELSKLCLKGTDAIIHIAGYAHDRNSYKKQYKKKHENLNFLLTKNLAKLAEKEGVKKFIFISSIKAGGTNIINGYVDEESKGFKNTLYSNSKRKAEHFLLQKVSENKMQTLIIRPSLVYGPNMKGNLKLMQGFINKGFFPPLPNTNSLKALVHVDDVARSILFLLRENTLNKEIYNITDGNLYSPREIYESLSLSLGKEPLNWSIPFLFFTLLKIIPGIKEIVDKIFIHEPYSSKKIRSLGFHPKCNLKNINEKIF
jgi:nucleoside-diphosphate-sugar epimerase